MKGLQVFPPGASTVASGTDSIFLVLLAIFLLLLMAIAGTIIVFSVRYRRGKYVPRGLLSDAHSRELEIGWTVATLAAFLFIFAWAAAQNFSAMSSPGRPALTVHVVAKQWMWKLEHEGGQREINTLHLPEGKRVRLILNSEDVIHSFYVPAFRMKMDLVPGHDEAMVFEPTTAGTYDLFCTEFCGTAHSEMRGKIIVMRPEDFARWLQAHPPDDAMASQGAALFASLGCAACHAGGTGEAARAPRLEGVFGKPVSLSDGRVVTADDAYLRDSILQPKKDVVAGYDPIMPSFAGRVSEADLLKLTAYIRALGRKEAAR